jgi:putative acetyltransferase
MQIRVDDLKSPEIAHLLEAHLENSQKLSPRENIHALDLEALRGPEITFWTAWDGASLLGCGALREIDPAHGEIKSMHTAAVHRRRGVAVAMVAHIIEAARARSYRRLSLETGSMEGFAPARALYAGFGFAYCEPFDGYLPDPNSVFMTLELEPDDQMALAREIMRSRRGVLGKLAE